MRIAHTRRVRLAVAIATTTLLAAPSAVALAQPPPAASRHGADRVVATKAHRAHAKTDLKNPSRNLAPHPNYQRVCATHRYTYPKCITEVLAAIRNARAAEHVKKPAMILPKNFTKLNAAEQTFVVTDLERVARGRRPFKGLTAALDSAAHTAAVTHEDPTIATSQMDRLKIQAWGSIWAGDLGPLAADYDWMYNDGYSKHNINLGCQTPSSADCWGHRDNIIGAYNHLPMLTAGAGSAKPAGASLAEVMAAGTGKAPKFAYTWKDALDQGANGHRVIS